MRKLRKECWICEFFFIRLGSYLCVKGGLLAGESKRRCKDFEPLENKNDYKEKK